MSKSWRVIVHTAYHYKIQHEVGDQEMALEYARFCIERGARTKDKRGVVTFIPPHRIDKVKVVPPGVVLGDTKDEIVP